MFREESEISIMNGMSLCYAPSYINILGAQPGAAPPLNHAGTQKIGLVKETHQKWLSS